MKSQFSYLGLAGLLIIHLLILKSVTFTAWPEMFSYPYLINNGFLLYKDIAHPYVPLLSYILAIFYKIAGMTLQSHQSFTWSSILVNDVLIFFIAKKLLKPNLILIPVILYVFLQPIFEGNMLWFDLATVPFILGSFLAFLTIKNSAKKMFFTGLLLSLALLIKQQAIILVSLVALVLLLSKETRKKFLYFIFGSALPVAVIFVILFAQGIFNDYIFWTLEFPLKWLPTFQGYTDMPTSRNILLLILLFGTPVIYLITNFVRVDIFSKIILAALLATVAMSFPRFSFFHLQPAIAVLIIFYILITKSSIRNSATFLLVGFLYGLLLWKDYQPFMGVETARFHDNEEVEMANFINENTGSSDSVYFLGPHSLVFVIANKLPPKPWIENFVWHFEIPGMQERQIAGFEKEKNLVIFKQGPIDGNWYDLGTYQPKKIQQYITDNFEMINKSEEGLEVWKRKN